MRRRKLIGLLGAAAFSFPRRGHAQTNNGLPVVGVLMPGLEEANKDRIVAIRKGLQQLGFIEGTNYSLAARFADGDFDRLPSLARELGALKPRLIVASANAVGPVRRSLPDMPIVFTGFAADPVALGLAESYVRPGGMITGNVMNAVGGELAMTQKRIGLFRDLVPNLTRLGMIAPDPGLGLAATEKEALRKVAAQLGFEFMHYGLRTMDDLDGAFASGLRDGVSAFYISGEPLLFTSMSRVMPIIAAAGKPTAGTYPEWGRAGLLMSYSNDLVDGMRQAGVYAAKILSGAKPGDLPIEQASKFTFVINLKTAKALGVSVPPTLLALADEAIE